MTLPAQFDGLDRVALPASPLHVAIGIFDGVHLGHRVVIESAVQSARHSGGVSVVLTFAPHPSVLFTPDNPMRMILDLPSKMAQGSAPLASRRSSCSHSPGSSQPSRPRSSSP